MVEKALALLGKNLGCELGCKCSCAYYHFAITVLEGIMFGSRENKGACSGHRKCVNRSFIQHLHWFFNPFSPGGEIQ